MIDPRRAVPPFVHVVPAAPDPQALDTDHVHVLDGASMTTYDGLMDEFSRGLQLPDYFGRNWDALDECLADLSWLPAGDRVVLITDAERILESESVRQLDILWKVLRRAGIECSTPIARGETWDRPARALHFLLVAEPGASLRANPS